MKIIRKITVAALMLALASCSAPEQVDVLVVGGGASGTAAGIQAARMGVRTMVLEETPWIGGMLTAAGVSCVDGNNRLRSGIFGEFADSLVARYGSNEALQSGWVSNINFDPHIRGNDTDNVAFDKPVPRFLRVGQLLANRDLFAVCNQFCNVRVYGVVRNATHRRAFF